MYYVHTKDLVMDDPYPMYQMISELIEADGEAEDFFLQEVADDGYVKQCFTVIDDVSGDDIELDITDYMGNKAFNTFEKLINNYTEEEGELSLTKVNSWYLACLKAKR